jgi:D-beta-D-heptose 7-phosphate kinase/D-beta-D-heptose 1-phosphate adenosyltransferase
MNQRIECVFSKLMTVAQLRLFSSGQRDLGASVVFTNGCFDLLHVGHVTLLQAARSKGDCLIVAVNSDSSVRARKGPSRPIISEQDRVVMLSALSCVDAIVLFDESPLDALRAARPDFLVKGADYTLGQVVGREVIAEWGGMVVLVPRIHEMSTTLLVSRLRALP